MSRRSKPVMVAVDRSPSAPQVVRLAADEAARRDADLVVLHACARPDDVRPALRWLHGITVGLADLGVAVEVSALVGPPTATITDCLAHTDVMVLGADRKRRGSRRVAAEVLSRSSAEVLVHRPGMDPPVGGVLLALVGTDDQEAAIEVAFRAAERRHCRLHAIAVGAADDAVDHEPSDVVHRWSAKCPAVAVSVSVRRDLDAAVVVAAASRAASLVVVGSDDGPWIGTTASALVERAHCPVLVVPRRTADADGRADGPSRNGLPPLPRSRPPQEPEPREARRRSGPTGHGRGHAVSHSWRSGLAAGVLSTEEAKGEDHDVPHRDQRVRPDRPQLPEVPARQGAARRRVRGGRRQRRR